MLKIIKNHYWVFIVALIFFLDYSSKILVLQNLELEQPISILPVFDLLLTFNNGLAFGFLNNDNNWQRPFFIVTAFVISMILIAWQLKTESKDTLCKISLSFILGGTLGNAYDRIVYHKVVDFLHFYYQNWHYPIFNIADSAICIGTLLLIFEIIRREKQKV